VGENGRPIIPLVDKLISDETHSFRFSNGFKEYMRSEQERLYLP